MWEFRGDRLFASPPLVEDQDDPDLMVDFCEKVLVAQKNVDLLTGNETVDILLYKPYGSKRITLDRDKLAENGLLRPLIRQGLTIIDGLDSMNIVKNVLLDTESAAPVVFQHNCLGFHNICGTPYFLSHHPIGENLTESQKHSTYAMPSVTCPIGSMGSWRRFLIKEAANHPELGLVLALSVTAPVAHILKEESIFTEIPLWALIGDSSSGKSTVLHLAGSIWGNPAKLMRSFHATSSAFFAMLNEQCGLPFLADEATHVPSFDFDDLIYSLPTGQEKRRCKSGGDLRSPVEFSGAILMTSEISILERTKNNSGQRARLIEFTLNWTNSREQADRIRAVCAKNYGWGAEPIMSLLLSSGFTRKLIRKYRFYNRELSQDIGRTPTGVDHRLIQRLALILTAAWVFQKAVQVDLHLDKIRALLSEVFAETAECFAPIDEVDSLHDFILSEIAQHQSHYPPEDDLTRKRSAYRNQNLYGAHGFWGNTACVWVLDRVFRDMLKRYGKFSHKSACRKLEEKGYLVRFYGDRFVKSTILGTSTPYCYCVLLPALPSVAQEVNNLPSSKCNQLAFAKHLKGDPLGSFNDFSTSKRMMHSAKDTQRMAVGFLWLSAQCHRLVLNDALKRALTLTQSTPLYIVAVPESGLLMMSRAKLLSDAPKISLHSSKAGKYLWGDAPIVGAIASCLNLTFELYEREVFCDITIEHREAPVAVVNIRNSMDTRVCPLNKHDPCSIDDLFRDCQSSSNDEAQKRLAYLLSDDEEDEED